MRTLRIAIAALLLPSFAYAQRATRPASTDPWEVTELTNRPSLTLELPALNTVRAARAAAFEVRPVLVVRCQDRVLDVFVAAGSVLESGRQRHDAGAHATGQRGPVGEPVESLDRFDVGVRA